MEEKHRMKALKLLRELEKHLSGDEKEKDNGESESIDEVEREYDSSDRDEEECSSDAEVEGDEGQHDEKRLMDKKMSPDHKKKMAIILLKKKMKKE